MAILEIPTSGIQETIEYLTVPSFSKEALGAAIPVTEEFHEVYGAICPEFAVWADAAPNIVEPLELTTVERFQSEMESYHRGEDRSRRDPIFQKSGGKSPINEAIPFRVYRVTTCGVPSRRVLSLPKTAVVFRLYETHIGISGRSHTDEILAAWTKKSGYFPLRYRGTSIRRFADLNETEGTTSTFPAVRTTLGAMRILPGFALSMRYAWSIYIWEEGCRKLKLPADHAGILKAFKLRDVPAGKQRRAAIVNWINEHKRRKPGEDEDAQVLVRRHLRGATEFCWNGFHLGVQPPAFDLEREAKSPPLAPKVEQVLADIDRWNA